MLMKAKLALALSASLLAALPASAQREDTLPELPAYLFREDPSAIEVRCDREGTIAVFTRPSRTGDGGSLRGGTVPPTPRLFICRVPGELGEAEWVDLGDIPDGTITSAHIVDGTIVEGDLNSIIKPNDGECLTYEFITGKFEWLPCTNFKRLSGVGSDRTTSSTSFSDVTGLSFAVDSSVGYYFTCDLSQSTAATTTAIKLSVNGPSLAELFYTVEVFTSATGVHGSRQTAYNTATNPASGSTTIVPARVTGSMAFVSSGTFSLRFASEVSGSAVTIHSGSYCTLGRH